MIFTRTNFGADQSSTRNSMVKLGLFIKAELDGVTDLIAVDTLQNPYFYTFKVMCNSCHEVNDSWITISRQVHIQNVTVLIAAIGESCNERQ